jgi:hypothetical protein
MRVRQRPPIVEYLVFGTALVLAVIVGYYALARRPWARPPTPYEPPPAADEPSYSAGDGAAEALGASGTRELVT